MAKIVYLAGYEYRKILKRRSTWIALAVVLAWVLFGGFAGIYGNYYMEGEKVATHFQMVEMEREALGDLVIKKLDQGFFEKKKTDMETIVKDKEAALYSEGAEGSRASRWKEYYRAYAPYGKLYDLLGLLENCIDGIEIDQVDGENFYSFRDQALDGIYGGERLSHGEIEFHKREDGKVPKPYAYGNMAGYEWYLQMLSPTCIILAFAIAIILAPMFAGEYSSHMDALALSCRYGKNKLIWAKVITGISFAAFSTLFFAALSLLEVQVIYGLDGWDLPVQASILGFFLILPINFLGLAAVATGCCLAAACMVAMVVMFCSAKMKTPFGVIIVSFIFIFAPIYLIYMVAGHRVLFMVVNSLPTSMMFVGSMAAPQLLAVGGRHLYFFQWVPPVYLVLIAGLALWSFRTFQRHEVQ